MGDIFLKIFNMSISASWLILAVVIIRLIFRKAPKWSMCLLWGLVAVKLVVPFSPESVLSLIPSNEVIPENIATETHPHIHSGITYIDMTVNPVMESNLSPQIGDSVNPLQVIIYIAGIVWCVGIIICLAYALVSYIILKRKVGASKLLRKGIYACDEVKSPFILGLFRPVIYIPSGMKDEVMEYVIAHENAHLKRGDHFWKPLGFIILSVYWFNPLCWVAYILLCRDIEYACDEKVICDKDREYVNLYSQALLDCNAQRRIIAACPLAFGETDVKGRIKGILNYKKPAFWVIIASLIICIVVAICFMTKQKQEEPGRIPPELIVRIEGSNEGVSATVRSYTWAEDSIGNDEVMSLEDLHPNMDHSVTDLKFDVDNVRLVLEFAEEPDEVLVKFWDEKYVDEGGDLGEGFTEISYNAETHTIDIPGFRSLYYTVRASWENRGGASYAFLINRGDTAGLNEENTELYVSMQVIDDEHADFLFEASDGSLSDAEYLENIWLYFSGDYSRYILEMLTDPKDGQENAFMYDSLENVAVGVVTIDKMENGIILHADMSAAESWEGVSFSNLKSNELRYRMSTGEEYFRLIDLSESSNPEGFNDADNRIGTAYAEYSAVVTEVTYDPEKGYSVVVTDSTNPGEYYGEYYGLGIVYVIVGDEIKVGDRIGEYWRPIDASEIRTDICELYLEVLEDLWNVDPGLNDGISQIGIDLSELSHLTELEKETVMHEFASKHNLPFIAGTWEELCEQGYIDKDNLYWEDGLFFSIKTNEDAVWNLPSIAFGDQIPELTSFDAQKWRSGLGAYYFDQCTAQKNDDGKWSYFVGLEAIS